VSRSIYLRGADGLPARVSGGWAQEKLQSLDAYLRIVNKAMEKKFASRCYIDLMAGCGRCVLKRSDSEFVGSPLVALACFPAFSSLVLVESDKRLFDALAARTAGDSARAHLVHGDCNDSNVVQQIRTAIPSSALSIAFIDNLGLDVAFETIRLLTAGRRIDLVITFQVSDIRRNVDRALTRAARGAKWDRFFGSPGWRRAVADFEARKTTAPDLGSALENFYASQLATIGYANRTQLNRSMKNIKNAPLYRVMLFSKNPLATKLFDATSSARSQQPGLKF
jgi:three-Cys-motif partner protein